MHSSIALPKAQCDSVMIVGHGRSGTNWLLDVLDTSPLTHGRNEPNEIMSSPLAFLPSPWVRRREARDLATRWDEAAQWAAHRMGNRDHHAQVPKFFHHGWATALHLPRALVRRRIRKALASVSPGLRAEEWPLPWWAGSQRKMEEALPVLKFTQVPGWACWVLEHRPHTAVLHIVRHPGGFLNSWRNRYLAEHESADVAEANVQRLRLIAEAEPEWAKRFPPLGSMRIEESELWFWRYAAEVIHEAGEGKPQYMLINYEHMTADPLPTAEGVFRHCGLPWDDEVAARVRGTTGESKSIAKAWRDKLSTEDVALVERILDGSTMSGWWE